jgi:hypothetical protein
MNEPNKKYMKCGYKQTRNPETSWAVDYCLLLDAVCEEQCEIDYDLLLEEEYKRKS